MASIVLRPTADSSLKHSCSSGSSGYALVNEATADGDSTYVYQSISSTSSVAVESRFKCSGGAGVGKIKISSVTLTVNAKTTKGDTSDTARMTYWLTSNTTAAGGVNQSALTTSYSEFTKTYSDSDLNIADIVFDSFDAVNFFASVLTSGKKNKSKNDDFQNRITQIYLTVEYEPYVPVYYTCSAVAGDGIEGATVSSSSVESGETCTFTATLSGSNTFAGWYSDSSYSTLVSTANPYTATISANTTLYAKANIVVTYTLKAIAGDGIQLVQIDSSLGGADEPAEITAEAGESVSFYAFPKDGYDFACWYDVDVVHNATELSDIALGFNESSECEKVITDDVTLCAVGLSQEAMIHTKDTGAWEYQSQSWYLKLNGSWSAANNTLAKWMLTEYLRGESATEFGKTYWRLAGYPDQKFKVVEP